MCFSRVRGGRVCLRQDRAGVCVKDADGEAPTDGALASRLKVIKCKANRVDSVDISSKQAGLALIAVDRFPPLSKPDPLEEAEKLVPALFLRNSLISRDSSHDLKDQDWPAGPPQMFWFKDPATLTIWTRGLLTALNVSINWRHNLHQRQESEVALEQAALGRGDDFERYHGGSSGSRNGTSHSPFLWVEGGAKLAERNGSTGSATTVTNESLHEQWEGEGSVVSKSEGPVEAGSLPIDLLGVVLTSNEVETEKRPRAPSLKKDLASNLTDLGDERFNRSSIRDAVLSPYINGADTSLLGSLSQDGDSLKRGGEEHLLDEPPFLNFVDVPWEGAFSTCFDDAVLLSSPTNGAFIPDSAANDWLRSQALRHCGVEEVRKHQVRSAGQKEPS